MKKYFSLFVILFCLPFILWAVCAIMPTFDDYTSLQSTWWVQIADPGYFFPDSVRRPFDALLGGILGWQPALFPTLNHVLIILGHAASACLVFSLCQRLLVGDASKRCNSSAVVGNASKRCRQAMLATNIATLFFFFSPATLGATLACDGFNQTYAQLWGLLALWTYLKSQTSNLKPQTSNLWLLCVLMAVFSKENGLAWAVVPPLVAYAFRLTDRKQTIRDIGKGLLLAVAYLLLFATLAFTGMLEYSDEYSEATLLSHVKDFVQLMAYTWVPLDYMSVVYPPTRNWTIVIVTLLLSLPFLLLLAGRWRLLKSRTLPVLIACFLILVSPHLVTVVSIMHNYAALSIASLIVAVLLSTPHSGSKFFTSHLSPLISHPTPLFILYLSAALFTDVHHYIAARESGLLGKHLATQAITHTNKPIQHAMLISIDDPEEPRYSSFCVRPIDAFAWGLVVRHYSHYEWKTRINEVTLPKYDSQQVEALADSALQAGCEAVWVVGRDKENLEIISPQ